VYGGAILMLFVFVIALLSSGIGPFSEGPNRLPGARGPAAVVTVLGFVALVYAVLARPLVPGTLELPVATVGQVGQANVFGSLADFGTALFTTYLLPFEVTAFVLLVAIIGVITVAADAAPQRTGHHLKRKRSREREPIVKTR